MLQRIRVPLGFVVAGLVLYFAEPTTISILTGLPIALLGALFRLLAAGVIHKDSELATSGIYGLTRNPLYLGSSLLAAGFAIMSANNIAAVLLLAPFILIYPTIVLREESHLAKLFPEQFRQYKSKVPRFFPFPARVRLVFSFQQYMANREYNAALGFLAAMSILVAKWWRG